MHVVRARGRGARRAPREPTGRPVDAHTMARDVDDARDAGGARDARARGGDDDGDALARWRRDASASASASASGRGRGRGSTFARHSSRDVAAAAGAREDDDDDDGRVGAGAGVDRRVVLTGGVRRGDDEGGRGREREGGRGHGRAVRNFDEGDASRFGLLRDFDERLAAVRARTREARADIDKIERWFSDTDRARADEGVGAREEGAGRGNAENFLRGIQTRAREIDGLERGIRDEYEHGMDDDGRMRMINDSPSSSLVVPPRTVLEGKIHRPIPRRAGAASASVEGTAWTAGGRNASMVAKAAAKARFEFGSNASVYSVESDSKMSAFKSLSTREEGEVTELRHLLEQASVRPPEPQSVDGLSTPPRIMGSPLRPPIARRSRTRTLSEDFTRNRPSMRMSQEFRHSMRSHLTPVEHVAVEAELERAVRMSEISSEDLQTANEATATQYLSNRASADEMTWRDMTRADP